MQVKMFVSADVNLDVIITLLSSLESDDSSDIVGRLDLRSCDDDDDDADDDDDDDDGGGDDDDDDDEC